MKNKYVKIFFTFIIGIVCLFGIDYVDAKTVAMGIKSNKTTVEPGDTIRIDLPVLCVAKGTNVSKIDTGFEYDSNALTATEVKNVKYFNGWKNVKDNLDDKNGSFVISLKADSSKNYINSDNASGDCGDDTYVTLVSGYELKVKDVANQKTTIWVLQDGERSTSIDINIYKTNDNNNLKELNIEGVEIEPKFSPNVTSYEAEVDYDKEKVVISAVCDGDNCSVSNAGEKELQVGENRFEIVVTAENGSRKKYNIFINRKEASSDTTLSSLKIKDSNGNNVAIGFKSDKRSYDVNVNNDILFVEFDAKCNGANCKIDDIDTKKLNVGNNSFKIKVTAEDGTTGEYKINIIREKKKSIIPYIIGGIILALLIALGIVFFIRRNKDKKAKRTNVESIDIPEDNFDINNLQ